MIIIDSSEPVEIRELVAQSQPISVTALNQSSIADYFFTAIDAHRVQLNRTQAGELLGDIDSFEDELRRYYNSAEETYAIIEGIISPQPLTVISTKQYFSIKSGSLSFRQLRHDIKGPAEVSIRTIDGEAYDLPEHTKPQPNQLFSYKVEQVIDKYGDSMNLIVSGRSHQISPKLYKAWLLQLDKVGITVFHTINYVDTAASIVAFYENLQKTEHTTLQRYIKPKIHIRTHNPHVQALINLSQAYKLDIGVAKAEAIIDYFDNLSNVLMSDVKTLCEVEGVGKTIAQKLVDAIGAESE